MKKTLLYIFISLIGVTSFAQVTANAGADKTVCPGVSTTIGGSPSVTGGTAPYTITWAPSTGLNSVTSANPTVNISGSVTYTLTVRDSKDSVDTDIVTVTMDDISLMNAGADRNFCLSDSSSVALGNSNNHTGPYTFLWLPSLGLSDTSVANPVASPTVTTSYTMQITSPTCGIKTDVVTIYIHTLDISAGNDTTIFEGQTISLIASPNDSIYTYWWGAANGTTVLYNTTYNPDVSPGVTTEFLLTVTDQWKCKYYDYITVNVLPSSELYFYNSITPNGDGDNDVWVVKNLENYPDNKLQIFNRYGQEVYSVHKYQNDWSGKYLGQNLPAGTYFFVLDTNTEKGKVKGSITIFR
ncbi:MAG TPA: gliding motility-associated C-terminal domain-containing protein [Bacteroidia bacterium]